MMKTESSDSQISLGKLATTLLVTALCSQALPVGFWFLFSGGVGAAFGDSRGGIEETLSIFFILGGPLALGLYFKQDWRGAIIGVSGLLGDCGGLLLFYLVSLFDKSALHSYIWLGLFPYQHRGNSDYVANCK